MNRQQPYFTIAQMECLRAFAKQACGASELPLLRISFHLIGSEDLTGKKKAVDLLQALQTQDWRSAAAHCAMAGVNDLLLGIILRIENNNGKPSNYWVAMRSPFELMDWPSILAAGKLDHLPPVEMKVLS